MKTLLKWSVEDYHNMIDAGILCDIPMLRIFWGLLK